MPTPPLDTSREAVERSALAIEAYAEHHGGVHVDGCPEDDTCFCSFAWMNDGVNAAPDLLRALLAEREAAESAARRLMDYVPGYRRMESLKDIAQYLRTLKEPQP
jgi:hypothetical protein